MSILWKHHILPETLEGHLAFRGLDQQVHGVQAQRNLIYLPADYGLAKDMGISPHPGGHDALYTKAVRTILDHIATIEDSNRRATEIDDLIDAMRIGFVNGDLYTNTPLGGTGEEVARGVERVITGRVGYRGSNLNQVEAFREFERKSAEAGYGHLTKFYAILGNAEREKLLSEVIRKNPRVNITSGNKDLAGTPWQKKFVTTDDDFDVPDSEPVDPNQVPQLPGFMPSPLPGFAPEGFTRSDPRLSYGLSGFPATSPDWQQFGQLPPSTAAPSTPQVLQFNPETGQQQSMSDGSPMLGPNLYDKPDDPRVPLMIMGTLAAAVVAPESLPAWIWALGTLGTASAVAGSAANAKPSNNSSGGVFAAGAPPYNPFRTGVASNAISNGTQFLGTQSGVQPLTSNPLDQAARSSTFVDRFGTWPASAIAATPSPPLGNQDEPTPSSSGAAAPEDIRRLTRANAANAASVFKSGSAPVPYLPSSAIDARFGDWREQGRPPQQASGPLGTFADEPPGYSIPPPIWGLDASPNRQNDTEWFSRWIRPLLHQD